MAHSSLWRSGRFAAGRRLALPGSLFRAAAGCLCVAALAGCEPSAPGPASPAATTAAPRVADLSAPPVPGAPNEQPDRGQEAPLGAAAGTPQTPGPAAETPPPQRVDVPQATAEQIERWKVAPFEPLQLLAVCEWSRTSFTECLAAAPGGRTFLVGGSRVLLWSVDRPNEPEHVFLDLTAAEQDRSIHALAVSPDGTWFVAGDSQGISRAWSLDDRRELAVGRPGRSAIKALAIAPDGSEIATISFDTEVTIWNAQSLERTGSFKIKGSGLQRIEYTAPQTLAAAGESAALWNTSTGEEVSPLPSGRYSVALGRSPDGARLIYGGRNALGLWNIADARQEGELAGGVSGSERVAFSADGEFLATTGGRAIQVWNLKERRAVQVIDSFGWPIVGVAWLPGTELLAVASESGCTRVWGAPGRGAAAGLKPLHAAAERPVAEAPATPERMREVIDLRTFPRLPGSQSDLARADSYNGRAPVSVAEANSFYRHFLEQAGWSLLTTPSAVPDGLEFRRKGFRLLVHCTAADGGGTSVTLQHAGNYDLRQTPRFDARPTESVYESENTVIYRTEADLVTIETWLLRQLPAAGWTGYSRLNTSHSERTDERDLTFVKAGGTLQVSIGRFPTAPDSYTISYALFPENSTVPIPPDCGFAEFDGSTEPALIATTKLSLEEAAAFYDRELSSYGWLIRQQGRSLKEDHGWLSYLQGQSNLTVELTALDDGRTLVQIGRGVASLWENAQARDEPVEKSERPGLEAADFPAPEGAQPIRYDRLDKSLEIRFAKTTLPKAAEELGEALAKLGWEPKEGGVRSDEYMLVTFVREGQEISLRARQQAGTAVVNVQGDGLQWTKKLPMPKVAVSYATWLRLGRLPAGLEELDRYEQEMRAIESSSAEKPPTSP